jgi:hypothetical protein
MKKYLLIWALCSIVFYFVVEKSGYLDGGNMAIGVAVIALLIMLKFLGKTWSGVVTEIKTEEKYYSDEDGGGETKEIDYAYIKLTNGKIKKVQDLGWKVGDKIEKKRGSFKPQVVS